MGIGEKQKSLYGHISLVMRQNAKRSFICDHRTVLLPAAARSPAMLVAVLANSVTMTIDMVVAILETMTSEATWMVKRLGKLHKTFRVSALTRTRIRSNCILTLN